MDSLTINWALHDLSEGIGLISAFFFVLRPVSWNIIYRHYQLKVKVITKFLIAECEEGFHNLFEQQCYHVAKRSEDWFGAQEYCYSRRSYLAEFSDIEEQNAMKAYLQGNRFTSFINSVPSNEFPLASRFKFLFQYWAFVSTSHCNKISLLSLLNLWKSENKGFVSIDCKQLTNLLIGK